MTDKKSILWILVGIMFAVQISGCAGKSQPTRFYTLTSAAEMQESAEMAGKTNESSIGIGPIKMADYLTQSRIITRLDDNRINRAEFDQWSGSIEDNVVSVLADNIGSLLRTEKVVIYPWRSYVPIDYQIELAVIRLDGRLDEYATLEARWIILTGKDKNIVAMRRSTINESIEGSGFAAMVAAQSRALGRLSAEIAASIDAVTTQ